ncbi:MAG: outer membrane lipoprotein-sorting protein [Desulfobacteraceae bacterium]|nr:outer membrane lipoprotein-sorting protein [Desulfobacteraceae bacterium]
MMRGIPKQIRKRKKSGLSLSLLSSLLFLFWIIVLPVLADQPGDKVRDQVAGQKMDQLLEPDSKQGQYSDLTGSDIMTKVFLYHKIFPYVYEEQTMILTDNIGNKDVRKLRRFSRMESDGTMKYLLVFDYPSEVKGLALRFIRDPKGNVENHIYLPALGKEISIGDTGGQVTHLLGTDFALEDLVESFPDFLYARIPDQTIAKVAYFVVEAFPMDKIIDNQTGYSKRRLFIRQDNFFIVRTDYFDLGKRFSKRLTRHDLKKVDKKMWRANMLLMENKAQQHSTLIKINQRVFSRDYVQPEIFTLSWLLENYKIQEIQDQPTDNIETDSIETDSIETDNIMTDNNIGN